MIMMVMMMMMRRRRRIRAEEEEEEDASPRFLVALLGPGWVVDKTPLWEASSGFLGASWGLLAAFSGTTRGFLGAP